MHGFEVHGFESTSWQHIFSVVVTPYLFGGGHPSLIYFPSLGHISYQCFYQATIAKAKKSPHTHAQFAPRA
jgi:hypothetical protein